MVLPMTRKIITKFDDFRKDEEVNEGKLTRQKSVLKMMDDIIARMDQLGVTIDKSAYQAILGKAELDGWRGSVKVEKDPRNSTKKTLVYVPAGVTAVV